MSVCDKFKVYAAQSGRLVSVGYPVRQNQAKAKQDARILTEETGDVAYVVGRCGSTTRKLFKCTLTKNGGTRCTRLRSKPGVKGLKGLGSATKRRRKRS